MAPYDLTPAECRRLGNYAYVVTAGPETIDDRRRCPVFDPHDQAVFPPPAGSIECGLRVKVLIDRAHDNLQVALRLHEAAHHAEGTDCGTFTGEESRNDRVVRPFTGCKRVWMGRVEREIRTAVLERDTRAWNNDRRTETLVVALDEAHHVSIAVGRAEVHGSPTGRVARYRHGSRLRDQRTPRRGVGLVEQSSGRYVNHVGVGDVGGRIRERELHRFDLQMPGIRIVKRRVVDIESLHDVQRVECADAMAVRRDLPYVEPAVVRSDRVDPLRFVCGQIFRPEVAAGGLREGADRLGQGTFVEGLSVGLGDRPQSCCVIVETHDLAHAWRRVLGGEGREPGCVLGTGSLLRIVDMGLGPVPGDNRTDRETLLGQRQRRLEQFRERDPPESFVEFRPRRDRTGHRDRQPTEFGHARVPERPEALQRCCGRGSA